VVDGVADPERALGGLNNAEHHWRVQRLLTEMAAADPGRYVVVDADGSEAAVAERVRTAMTAALKKRGVPAELPTNGSAVLRQPSDDLTGAGQETA
jgi:dTMP kinase